MAAWLCLGLMTLLINCCSFVTAQMSKAECKTTVNDYNPKFHIKLPNIPTALNFQTLYTNNSLAIIYESGVPDKPYTYLKTTNFNDYINFTSAITLPAYTQVLFVINDDDNTANFTNNTGALIAGYQVQSNNMQNLVYSSNWRTSWNFKCRNTNCFNITLNNAVSINWNEDLGQWLGQDTSSRLHLSRNLQNWTYFQARISSTYNEIEEEFFPISPVENTNVSKWVLLISSRPGYQNYRPGYYVLNSSPTGFVKEYSSAYALDYCQDSRYFSIAHDGNAVKGQKILVGSISIRNFLTPTSVPIDWSDIFLTPRRISLRKLPDRYYITQTPFGDFSSRVTGSHNYKNLEITPDCNHLACFRTLSYRIEAEIRLNTATRVGFIVRKSSSQGTEIGYDNSRGYFVDRRNSGFPVGANLDQIGNYAGLYTSNYRVSDGIVNFVVLVDVSVIEVFCEDGIVVFSFLVFSNPDSNAIELFAIGGNANARKLDLHVFDG